MSQLELEQLQIATPCPMSWDEMEGNDAVRFCSKCSLNVYNIAQMNRAEAEALVNETEGRVCLRLFRRSDGTIITRDCPVGRRTLKRQVLTLVSAVVGVFFIVGIGALASAGIIAQREWSPTSNWDFFGWFEPQYNPETGDVCLGGAMPVPQPLPAGAGPPDIDESLGE